MACQRLRIACDPARVPYLAVSTLVVRHLVPDDLQDIITPNGYGRYPLHLCSRRHSVDRSTSQMRPSQTVICREIYEDFVSNHARHLCSIGEVDRSLTIRSQLPSLAPGKSLPVYSGADFDP